MSKVTCDVSVTLDGFSAGPNQSEERPFGDVDGEALHRWMFEQAEQNAAEVAEILTARAYIMGRNMFGPIRGEWDRPWRGWWGEDPPYHGPVFVLTHYPHEPLPMPGGTTFYFVTDGIESALAQARAAAGDGEVSIAGGAHTVSQYLVAGAIDELRLHVTPVTFGQGERIFDGVGPLNLEQIGEATGTDLVTHLKYRVVR